MKLFGRPKEGETVNSWIALNPAGDTLRVTWPWLWGTVGFDVKFRLKFMYVSAWRENKMLGRV